MNLTYRTTNTRKSNTLFRKFYSFRKILKFSLYKKQYFFPLWKKFINNYFINLLKELKLRFTRFKLRHFFLSFLSFVLTIGGGSPPHPSGTATENVFLLLLIITENIIKYWKRDKLKKKKKNLIVCVPLWREGWPEWTWVNSCHYLVLTDPRLHLKPSPKQDKIAG